MRIRTGTLIVLALLLVGGLALSESETAMLTSSSGEVMLANGEMIEGNTLEEGATLVLGDGAEATVVFMDGAEMNLMGPARVKLAKLDPYMRRVDLQAGRINRFSVLEVTTGVHTPYESFVAVQNGTIGVNAADGRVVYNLFEGQDAKVVDLAEGSRGMTPLTSEMPVEIVREEAVEPDMPEDMTAEDTTTDTNSRYIKVGLRTLKLTPADGFDIVATPTGGVSLTCVVPQGEFGTVRLGMTTNFYLASGDILSLDSAGNVVRSTAIVHSLAALDVRGIYDEAIAVPGDSSPIDVGNLPGTGN